jgi:hypothetical protein
MRPDKLSGQPRTGRPDNRTGQAPPYMGLSVRVPVLAENRSRGR